MVKDCCEDGSDCCDVEGIWAAAAVWFKVECGISAAEGGGAAEIGPADEGPEKEVR